MGIITYDENAQNFRMHKISIRGGRGGHPGGRGARPDQRPQQPAVEDVREQVSHVFCLNPSPDIILTIECLRMTEEDQEYARMRERYDEE